MSQTKTCRSSVPQGLKKNRRRTGPSIRPQRVIRNLSATLPAYIVKPERTIGVSCLLRVFSKLKDGCALPRGRNEEWMRKG